MTPFETLGLTSTASESEVRQAFRELAKRHHPDLGGDASAFMALRAAYHAALKIASKPPVCENCGGTGRVMIVRGFGSLEINCPICKNSRLQT